MASTQTPGYLLGYFKRQIIDTAKYLRPEEPTKPPATLDDLAQLRIIAEDAEQAIRKAAAVARDQGASWAQIGDALGTTKQAAQQRYGHRGR